MTHARLCSHIARAQHPMAAFTGVLIIGVGDAVASAVGSYYGTLKWPDTRKSLQVHSARHVMVMCARASTVRVGHSSGTGVDADVGSGAQRAVRAQRPRAHVARARLGWCEQRGVRAACDSLVHSVHTGDVVCVLD
jgi:hypothetical protein